MPVSKTTGLKSDNILGYRIIEKIGSGGFGEVWKAEAPGGLNKAVKILYGYHDERRARDELKALDRVKELRHPFLLSLERIEVVDEQLIVITELADRSLADLFDSYVKAGQPGIPREELLHYMQQAADALDFLAIEHKLQHLDVKPENLLMIGKHVKLADFGLVKDLRDASQSLMSGLTPSFAAPELFDGRPSMQSDQYALAIVYQEMLTGQRPFSGTTLAQLAAQHIHGQPDLSTLPRNDRDTIARALSKKPELRFPHCRVMIDALVDQRMIARTTKRKRIPNRKGNDTVAQDIQPRKGDTSDYTRMVQTAELSGGKQTVQMTDPPKIENLQHTIGPTLLVAIGKTATEIVQQFKHRVHARNCPLHQLPAIRILCIDTERPVNSSSDSGKAALDGSEQVMLPLRRPEEYRTRNEGHKKWLNRRWIYNVPKSLQTEGIRPLGRLALIDNFPTVCECLEEAIAHIADRDALALTAERIGAEPVADRPKVIVVSSITGGLGSGMTLDLAYAIRLILDEHSLSSDCLHGIFLHSTAPSIRDNGISVANTFAFLTELRQFTEDGYPGEDACGIPRIDDEAPFEYPYFVHLGDNAQQQKWEQAKESVAEYLYLNLLSPAACFFDGCRNLERDIEHFALRTFGVEAVGPSQPNCQQVLADFMQQRLVTRWIDGSRISELPPEVTSFRDFLSPGSMEKALQATVDRACPDRSLDTLVEELVAWANLPVPEESLLAEIRERMDVVLGEPLRDGKTQLTEMHEDVADELALQARGMAAQVEQMIISCFQQKNLQFGRPRTVLKALQEWIDTSRNALSGEIAELHDENQRIFKALGSYRRPGKDADRRTPPPELARQMMANRKAALLKRHGCELLLHLQRRIHSLTSDINRFAEEVGMALQTGLVEQSERSLLKQFRGLKHDLAAAMLAQSSTILDQVETRLHMELVQPVGDYWNLFQTAGFGRRYLADAVSQAIRIELAACGRSLDMDAMFTRFLENNRNAASEEIGDMVSRSIPKLNDCGGQTRIMVASSQQSSCPRLAEEISAAAGARAAVINATAGDLVVATETEDVSLAAVAYKMLALRTDCVELARRLQSRSDVNWKSLEDLL